MTIDKSVAPAHFEPDTRSLAHRLVLVGGCPRSGTTLLQNMLDSHPEVLGGPEFLHLVDVINLRSKLLTSVGKGWIDLFCTAQEVDEQMRLLVYNFLLPLADKHDRRLLSEKSPENVLVLAELVELFPEAKFVYIVRDPRAIIASLLEAGRRARAKGEVPAPFAANVEEAIRYTLRCFKAGDKALTAAPDKIHVVFYEELVKAPELQAQKLCEFLELPWAPQMLFPAAKKHLGEAAITVNSKEIWYEKETYYSNPNASRVASWKRELKPREQIVINRKFQRSSAARELGYDFTRVYGSLIARLSGRLQAFLWQVGAMFKNRLRLLLGVKR